MVDLKKEWEKHKSNKQEDALYYKWVFTIENNPEVFSGEVNDLATIPKEILPRLAEKFDFIKEYLDGIPTTKYEEKEDGSLVLSKESVKDRINSIVDLDEIDREEALEELSSNSNIKITVLRKQLLFLDKKQKKILADKEENPSQTEEEVKPKYTEEQMQRAMDIFDRKDLLDYIKKEISKDHLGDDNLKMTLFLIEVSGLSSDEKRRMSAAVIASSSEGKTNAIKATLKHIPEEKYLYVTSATQASIEDDVKDRPVLVFSELNMNRDNGANKEMVEVIKQKTEGGTSAIKKDLRDGMKTTRHEKSEQGTVIFSTTESEMDDEMRTRFLNLHIKSTKEKINAVNNNTIDSFSDIDKILDETEQEDSLIRIGLTGFCHLFDRFQIIIPYAKYLKGFSFIDDADPRSKRDLKRVLSLTCAMTFLNSRRRKTCQKKGVNFIESVPKDLIDTLKISKEFFNQSYTGIDSRISSVLNFIDKHPNEWVERGDIQRHLNINSLNTLKDYLHSLAMGGMGLIEGKKGKDLNFESGNYENKNQYHSSKIYYKTCQKGVKKVFLTCQLKELEEYLDKKIKEESSKLGVEDKELLLKEPIPNKNDTFSLTPFSDEEIKKAGYTKEEYEQMLREGENEN